MRHSQAESNLNNFVSSLENANIHLTEKGKSDTKDQAKSFKDKKIDIVFSSNLTRSIETSDIIISEIGGNIEHYKDGRLNDISFGVFEGKQISEYRAFFNGDELSKFDKSPEGGETLNDVRKRVGDFIYEIDKKYQNKNILIVSHGDALWMLESAVYGFNLDKTKEHWHDNYMKNTEIRELDFVPLPHNNNYELDFHRPYIDEIILLDDEGVEYKRIPEVIDCWFESGSMPFAQDHYPFESLNWKKENFPSGFVAEYIAQTRTWFYYTHVISSILFNHAPFENVVTTGTILAEDGSKMSKSKNNFPDPWLIFDKYGVDALRFYLMSSSLMKGEDVNFSEKSVQEISSKIIGRLSNVVAFYELYRESSLENTNSKPVNKNVLDVWILARFDDLIKEVTINMDTYDMALAARPFDLFIDDLSTWYLRRSRDRLKEGDKDAKATLYFVIKNLAKLMAPFAPFASEDIWQTLKTDKDEESVHLSTWPEISKNILANIFGNKNKKVLNEMEEVRSIVNQALKERQKAGVAVRQPLGELKVKGQNLKPEYIEILKDELNIKNVTFVNEGEEKVSIDFTITPELKKEGQYREVVRAVQDMRKKMGLVPEDVISLTISENAKDIISNFTDEMKKTTGAQNLEFKNNDGENLDLGELQIQIKISK